MLSTGVSASLSNNRPAKRICHAQQTHVNVAAAESYQDLADDVKATSLRAIGVRVHSAFRGGTFHLNASSTVGGEPTKLGRGGMVDCIYTMEVGLSLTLPSTLPLPTPYNHVFLHRIRKARPQWRRRRQEGRRPPKGHRRLPCKRERDNNGLWCEAGQYR